MQAMQSFIQQDLQALSKKYNHISTGQTHILNNIATEE